MSTKPVTISSLDGIDFCWLYQSHQFDYLKAGNPVPLLPAVDSTYKSILVELGIPYRESLFDDYEFWDPDCYEEEEVTLPLFVEIAPNSFQLAKKRYTHKLVTSKTTEAAFTLLEKVVEPMHTEKMLAMFHLKEIDHQLELAIGLQAVLNGNVACGNDAETIECIRPNDMIDISKDEKLELKIADTHIIVLPVYTLISEEKLRKQRAIREGCGMNSDAIDPRIITDYIAIFDMNKLETGNTVDLFVPEGVEPIFVGRGAWQVKKWCKQLGGLWRINVRTAK